MPKKREAFSDAENLPRDKKVKLSAAKLSNQEWDEILLKKHYIQYVAFTADEGDLTIVITGGGPDGVPVWEKDKRVALTVQESKLDKALPGWKDQIARTKYPEVFGHLPVAELAPGTPRVLRYFIMAAHNIPTTQDRRRGSGAPRFKIEDDLTLQELREISVLSHQFNALHLISGNVSGWVKEHFPFGWQLEGYEGEEDDNLLNYLWMAYEFGLHKVFHQVCFNLAFVTRRVFSNPNTMPPGIYDQIYKAREAFAASLMSDISRYHKDLLNATAPGNMVLDSICSHDQRKECAAEQLWILDHWIKHENLVIDPEMSLRTSQGRSLLYFFQLPFSTRGIRRLHGRKNDGSCGLFLLENRIKQNDKIRLLAWMAETGTARLATEAHVAYMDQQREKLHWELVSRSAMDWL